MYAHRICLETCAEVAALKHKMRNHFVSLLVIFCVLYFSPTTFLAPFHLTQSIIIIINIIIINRSIPYVSHVIHIVCKILSIFVQIFLNILYEYQLVQFIRWYIKMNRNCKIKRTIGEKNWTRSPKWGNHPLLEQNLFKVCETRKEPARKKTAWKMSENEWTACNEKESTGTATCLLISYSEQWAHNEWFPLPHSFIFHHFNLP